MGYHGFGFKDCHSVYVYRIILNFVIRYIHIDKYIYRERESLESIGLRDLGCAVVVQLLRD